MKRFLTKFLTTFAILFTCIVVYRYAISPNITSGLSSLGKIPIGWEYVNNIHQHYPFDSTYIMPWHEEMEIDSGSVIVIGDSFSNREESTQKSNHIENSWSRYMAEDLGIQLVNFRNYHCGFYPEQLFVSLIEEQIIPDHCIVILETVERHLVLRLTSPLAVDNYFRTYVEGLPTTDMSQSQAKKKRDWVAETTVFMRYRMGKECPTHRFNLSQPCFTHQRYASTLFSYFEDEANMVDDVQQQIPRMRNTLTSLFRIAKQHDITLYYMIAADKYDAYEPLISNKHKRNCLLDYFPSNDSILNTKELLLPYILSGTQDVYRLDDTHWSPVGSKIVGLEMAARIKATGTTVWSSPRF